MTSRLQVCIARLGASVSRSAYNYWFKKIVVSQPYLCCVMQCLDDSTFWSLRESSIVT